MIKLITLITLIILYIYIYIGIPVAYGGNGTCGGTQTNHPNNPMSSMSPNNPNSPYHDGSCPGSGAGGLYNGMIAPFTPMALKSVLWLVYLYIYIYNSQSFQGY